MCRKSELRRSAPEVEDYGAGAFRFRASGGFPSGQRRGCAGNVQPDSDWGIEHLLDMKEELDSLFGRAVDLVEKRLVEESRNYIRRKHILSHMEAVYAA